MKYGGTVIFELWDGYIGSIQYIEGHFGLDKARWEIQALAHRRRTFIKSTQVVVTQ